MKMKNSMKKKAIFFDRDGVVNRRLNDYVKSIDEFVFDKYFFELFQLINPMGFISILVTNQQCVNKGIITEAKLHEIHNFMQEQLLENTNHCFTEIYFSPALANSGDKFRKPEPGMFISAINKYNIAPEDSWTIGDSITDVEAGKKVGTKTILIGHFEDIKEADFIFRSLKEVLHFFRNHNRDN